MFMVVLEHSLASGVPENAPPGPYLPYRHTLLTPTQIRQLSTLRPGRAMAAIAFCWSCILAAFALVVIHPAWWTVLLGIPVIGNRYYALFVIAHDGMHRRLFPNVKRNDFWTDLLILAPIGAITRINNRNHLAHHHNLATPLDPDRHKHACFNKTDRAELLEFLAGLSSIWNSAKSVYVAHIRKESPGAAVNSDAGHYSLRDFLMLAGWFIALAGGLTWLIGWWAYPVLWLLPVYLFMFLGDNFRSFAEHSHADSDRVSDQQRMISYISNPLERMLVAPMNMNLHAAHHLWPSIPYYNLPAADRLIRSHPDSIGLEWRKSYFDYLCSYWSALPIAECKQDR
jgi:fatty acid desaturase